MDLTKVTTRDALLTRLGELNDELAEIKDARASIAGQIEKAKADRHITGEFADPDWYRRAKGALRHMGVEEQSVTRQVGEVNRHIRKLNSSVNRDVFHDAVRDVVDERTWDLIVHRHEQLRAEEGI